MILAKRVKKAFAYDAQGKLSPVGENIFQFSRKRRHKIARGKLAGKTRQKTKRKE